MKTTIPIDLQTAVTRVKQALEAQSIDIFATFDHGANASAAGMTMPETVVLVFGNPKVGTLLMLDDINTAVELPLRLMFTSPTAGQTDVVYAVPSGMAERFELSDNSREVLKKMDSLMEKLVAVAQNG